MAIPCTPGVFGMFPTMLERIDIEHFHLRSVRNIQTPRRLIDRQIVETALAGDRNFCG